MTMIILQQAHLSQGLNYYREQNALLAAIEIEGAAPARSVP